MAVKFTIPTYFTAVDKFSAPVRGMSSSVESFVSKTEMGLAKSERAFKRLTPAMGEASKQLVSMIGTAALIGGAFAGVAFSGRAIMDYQTAIASLSAITGTSGKDLEKFESKIKQVAQETKSSSIDVAKAFTEIGNNSPQLLKDADALAEVTKQSIILAQAAKMELGPSADTLTSIMNQFNVPAMKAKSVIDLLAGGMVIGSTNIDAVADAMTRFGGVASQVAGVSMQESVTAIEAISDKMKDAEKVGTQFRNIFLIMSNIKGQDPKALKDLHAVGVNMDIVSSKTEPLINKLEELKKLMNRPGALEHVFSKENIQSLVPLLSSTDKYREMLKTLTTSEEAHNAAQKMADKNNATLARGIDMLKNKFVTWITTSEEAHKALRMVTEVTGFLADNMVAIFKVAGWVIGAFATWWFWIQTTKASILILKGISNAFFLIDMIKYVASTQGITFAQAAWAIATQSVTDSVLALTVAMEANPIGIVIIAVAALSYGIYNLIAAHNALEEAFATGIEKSKIEQINKQRQAVDELTRSYQMQGMAYNEAHTLAVKQQNVIDSKRNSVLNENAIQAQKKVDAINPIWDFLNGSNESKKANREAEEARGAMEIGLATKTDLNKPIDLAAERNNSYSETINKNINNKLVFDFVNMPNWMKVNGDAGVNSVIPTTSSTLQTN